MTINNEINTMNDKTLESVISEVSSVAKENEDISHIREIQENSNNSDEDLTSSTHTYRIKDDGKPDFTNSIDRDITGEDVMNAPNNTANAYNLTDDEASNIAEILVQYKINKKMDVYGKMIPSLKAKINKICMDSGIPLEEVGTASKYMMDQFISTSSESEEFKDIEKEIEKALKIPSMVDIYMDYINETMDVKLPAMAEEIKERDPEKAEAILKIRDEYNNAFLFSRLRDFYDNNTRARKLIRRDCSDKDVKKFADEANYVISSSEFTMPNCSAIQQILLNIMGNRIKSNPDFVHILVNKFCILLFYSASFIDLDNLTDAAYYYYMIKNISMLSYLGDKMSDFSGELISNINITMNYIYLQEASFHVKNHKK